MHANAAGKDRRRARSRNLFAAAFALLATTSLAVPFAWESVKRGLGPLDLSQLDDGSAIAIDRDGRLLRAFTTDDGRWRLPVTQADVDHHFLAMLKVYEDRRFDTHGGVDAKAMARAAIQFARNGRVISGGSTLTMQAARLLEPRDERTLPAKLRQMARALELEQRFSKNEIIDIYLALAPYGGNLEGLRAASVAYFGKEPKRLTTAEQALLVALPQSPEARRPDRNANAARAARNRVLDRAARYGVISRAEAEAAKLEPVPAQRKPFPALAAHAAEAAQKAAPRKRVLQFAYDHKLQLALEQLAQEAADRLGPKVTGSIVAIDNRTGEIRARVGSANYFSFERAGAIDMTNALRSPGSALKPFIYALAFENGAAHPETMMEDRASRFGVYAPENFDLTFQGQVSARTALQQSLNIPAVTLLSEIGPPRLLARLRNAGASPVLPEGAPGLAIGLGGLGISLVDLARLYSAIARGGEAPDLVERLDLARPEARGQRVCEPVACWYVADVLRGAPPPANAPAGKLAYKTGTSYGFRDAVAVGFDADWTIAVWFGRADNGAVPGLLARHAAAPVLFDAFARAGASYEPVARPPGVLVATNAQLPPPLRRIGRDGTRTTTGAAQTAQLKIAFPPDGARVDLGLAKGEQGALALKNLGGTPPFRWMVNGAPAGRPELRRQSAWTPDGAGFARVSVIDAKGASDSVLVRLE
ncbi:MAG: penicillin-binding protein 1C [Beijerinckiaceae bacterium]